MNITLKPLTEELLDAVRTIDRSDVSEDFVSCADDIWELTRWGEEHGCLGRTWAVYRGEACVGVLLLGEAIPWETDPPAMRERPFWRLMGFAIDRRYRGQGLGGQALEMAIDACCRAFGTRPIALGCHRDNTRAAAFYQRHGFVKTSYMEGNDFYYLRYPAEE